MNVINEEAQKVATETKRKLAQGKKAPSQTKKTRKEKKGYRKPTIDEIKEFQNCILRVLIDLNAYDDSKVNSVQFQRQGKRAVITGDFSEFKKQVFEHCETAEDYFCDVFSFVKAESNDKRLVLDIDVQQGEE